MLQFEVKDSGIGISSEFHAKIFDRFSQVEASNSRRYGGNGLGLAITKNLIELMGGRIWLESEPAVGTSFYFTLPLKNGE
jgi:signal transduction histidine kinase